MTSSLNVRRGADILQILRLLGPIFRVREARRNEIRSPPSVDSQHGETLGLVGPDLVIKTHPSLCLGSPRGRYRGSDKGKGVARHAAVSWQVPEWMSAFLRPEHRPAKVLSATPSGRTLPLDLGPANGRSR